MNGATGKKNFLRAKRRVLRNSKKRKKYDALSAAANLLPLSEDEKIRVKKMRRSAPDEAAAIEAIRGAGFAVLTDEQRKACPRRRLKQRAAHWLARKKGYQLGDFFVMKFGGGGEGVVHSESSGETRPLPTAS